MRVSVRDAATVCNAATVRGAGLLTWLERRRQWTRKPADYKRAARKRTYS